MSDQPLFNLGCQAAVSLAEYTAAARGATNARVSVYRTYPIHLARPRFKPFAYCSVTCPGCGSQVGLRVLSRWLSAAWALAMFAGGVVFAAFVVYLVYPNWHSMPTLRRCAVGALAVAIACAPLAFLWFAFREPPFMRASIRLPMLESTPGPHRDHTILKPD
jgi:hypothetical protein